MMRILFGFFLGLAFSVVGYWRWNDWHTEKEVARVRAQAFTQATEGAQSWLIPPNATIRDVYGGDKELIEVLQSASRVEIRSLLTKTNFVALDEKDKKITKKILLSMNCFRPACMCAFHCNMELRFTASNVVRVVQVQYGSHGKICSPSSNSEVLPVGLSAIGNNSLLMLHHRYFPQDVLTDFVPCRVTH